MTENKPIICVDFDGVLHSYGSGWHGANIVRDEPVDGAIEWLTSMVESQKYNIQIYSSRSRQEGGIEAMQVWLIAYGFAHMLSITFPTQKPAAYLTIDDRCICFNGTFPTQDIIDTFQPWNKKGV
jgi:hypothetical protein